MKTKVWSAELPPFPREGIFHLEAANDCPVTRMMLGEADRLRRLNQLEPPENIAELRTFQKKLRRKIAEKTGCVYDKTLSLDIRTYGVLPRDGYSITKLTYQSRPGVHVPALLYVPEGAGPFPAIVRMHGHFPVGKFGGHVQEFCQAFVKAGYVCIAPDAFGVYERACKCHETEYHGGFPGGAMLNLGESLMGAQIVDNRRAIDVLQSLPYVSCDRIGAAGASGGGNQTMYLAAMDERIKAAMPVVSVGSFESYVNGVNCVCELIPDGLTFCDEASVLALIAPRPLNIGNALYDCNHTFSVAEMLKTYHQLEKVYWNLGIPENLRYTICNRDHGMSDQQRDAALGWFELHLKGIGSGNPLPSYCGEPEAEELLHVFTAASERPAEVCGTDVYCRRVGEELHNDMLDRRRISRSQALKELAKVLRLRKLPAAAPLVRYKDADALERYALDVDGDHLLPILVKRGTAKGKFKLLLSPRGKIHIPEKMADSAAADGSSLVFCDLQGTGETARSNHLISGFHQTFRQMLWIGRSLPGEWVLDIIVLVRMLRKNFKGTEIIVEAEKETGFAAACAAALSREGFTVKAIDAPASFVFCRDSVTTFRNDPFNDWTVPGALYSPVLSIPGFLKWGDVSLIKALAGKKVSFVSPRAYDGTLWDDEACAAFEKEVELLSSRLV